MPAKVGYMSLQGHRITYLPVSIGFSVPGALIWVFIWVSEIHTNDMPVNSFVVNLITKNPPVPHSLIAFTAIALYFYSTGISSF